MHFSRVAASFRHGITIDSSKGSPVGFTNAQLSHLTTRPISGSGVAVVGSGATGAGTAGKGARVSDVGSSATGSGAGVSSAHRNLAFPVPGPIVQGTSPRPRLHRAPDS